MPCKHAEAVATSAICEAQTVPPTFLLVLLGEHRSGLLLRWFQSCTLRRLLVDCKPASKLSDSTALYEIYNSVGGQSSSYCIYGCLKHDWNLHCESGIYFVPVGQLVCKREQRRPAPVRSCCQPALGACLHSWEYCGVRLARAGSRSCRGVGEAPVTAEATEYLAACCSQGIVLDAAYVPDPTKVYKYYGCLGSDDCQYLFKLQTEAHWLKLLYTQVMDGHEALSNQNGLFSIGEESPCQVRQSLLSSRDRNSQMLNCCVCRMPHTLAPLLIPMFWQVESSAPSSKRTLSSSMSAVTAAPCRVGDSLIVEHEASASGEPASLAVWHITLTSPGPVAYY